VKLAAVILNPTYDTKAFIVVDQKRKEIVLTYRPFYSLRDLEDGNQGEGIIVGGIDIGVRYTHEALRSNYIGGYGWFDPADGSANPNDGNGHGTVRLLTF
jgi:subtilisin family serine protease